MVELIRIHEGITTVGSFIEAVVSWDLQELEGVTYYLHQCQVQTGSTNVKIIDEGCYSTALSVTPGTSTSNTLPISYIAFTGAAVGGDAAVRSKQEIDWLRSTFGLLI